MLTDQETRRYARQVLLQDIGEQGQLALKNSSALIVGLGGLGSPVALYLAAAGVGKLVVVDGDTVETSNLQRQILYKANHVGFSKAESAQKSLYGLNSLVAVEVVNADINHSNISELVAKADVVLDCTDNVAARHLINQSCVLHHTTLISGAAVRCEGQLMVFDFHKTPDCACYHCVFPQSEQSAALNCTNAGVFGPVLGVVGSLQALEAIKFLLGKPLSSAGKLQLFDGMSLTWQSFAMSKKADCPVCCHSKKP